MTSISGTAPNILQIIPRLDGGGAEATTLEITKALKAAGGRSVVCVLLARQSGEHVSRLRTAFCDREFRY